MNAYLKTTRERKGLMVREIAQKLGIDLMDAVGASCSSEMLACKCNQTRGTRDGNSGLKSLNDSSRVGSLGSRWLLILQKLLNHFAHHFAVLRCILGAKIWTRNETLNECFPLRTR